MLKNAKGDVIRVMILKMSWTKERRGKLMSAREKLARARWEDSSPKNCKSLGKAGRFKLVIYRGGSFFEENQV